MNSGSLYIRHSPATLQELSDLVKQSRLPAWRLQEKIDGVEFKEADAAWLEGLPSGLWHKGRVFGSQAEVRWWAADDDKYDIQILAETQLGLPAGVWPETKMETSNEYRLYLWGERRPTDSCWMETRIPHPLYYPIDEVEWERLKLPHIAIIARDYSRNGAVQLTRLVRLESIGKAQGGIHA